MKIAVLMIIISMTTAFEKVDWDFANTAVYTIRNVDGYERKVLNEGNHSITFHPEGVMEMDICNKITYEQTCGSHNLLTTKLISGTEITCEGKTGEIENDVSALYHTTDQGYCARYKVFNRDWIVLGINEKNTFDMVISSRDLE